MDVIFVVASFDSFVVYLVSESLMKIYENSTSCVARGSLKWFSSEYSLGLIRLAGRAFSTSFDDLSHS